MSEQESRVLQGLADSGGVIKPWMRYSIPLDRLQKLWKSGDWIMLKPSQVAP